MKNFILTFLVVLISLMNSTPLVLAKTDLSTADFKGGMLPNDWYSDRVEKEVDLPVSDKKGGLEQFQDLLVNNIAQIAKYLFVSIALIYAFVNVIIMIFGSSEENTIDEVKTTISHIMLGLILISLSSEFAKIFDPSTTGGAIGNEDQVKHVSQIIINFISLISGAVAIFYMLISAFRMIMAQGEESVIEEEKRDFQYGFVGLVVIIMADVMINKVFYPVTTAGAQVPGTQEHQTLAQEIFSLLSYLLEFLAITSIFFMVIAGGYYIISVGEDDQTENAKKILKNLVFGFIMIVFAYTVVSAVSPDLAGQTIAR
jgi:predicted permease